MSAAAPPLAAPLAFALGPLPGRDGLALGVVTPREPARALALLVDLRGALVGPARARTLGAARALLAGAGRPAAVVVAGTTPTLVAALAGDAAPTLPALADLAARVRPGAGDLGGAVDLLRREVERGDRGPAALDVVVVTDRPGDAALAGLARDGARLHVLAPRPVAGPGPAGAIVTSLDDDPAAAAAAVVARLAPARGPLGIALRAPPVAVFRRAGGPLLGGRADLARVEAPAEGPLLFVVASAAPGAPLGEATLDGATLPLDPAEAGPLDAELAAAVAAALDEVPA